MSEITNKINYFFEKLNQLQNELNDFNTKINNKSEKISQYLKDFEKNISKQIKDESEINNDSKSYISKGQNIYKINDKKNKNDKKDKVEEAYLDTVKQISKTIKELNDRIKIEKNGQKFINDNQKYLTVMIFGAVKAGKSSLGNFFAGKNFINAPFDNPYKHIPQPIFTIKESRRDKKDEKEPDPNLTEDEFGNKWFSEGVTDTTGAIQYFTLNGLRWIDSPGTGAVAKEGDKKDDNIDMTKLVEEYINYTDMCIFLMNSSEPGLQDDIKYIQKLNKEDQEALIVITKSDKYAYKAVNENGQKTKKKTLIGKPKEDRKLQEDDICERLKEQYPNIDEQKYRAISISTLLANKAIKSEDDQKFRDSNLDKLIDIICQKIDNAPTYKRRNPIRLLNNFIDKVNEKITPLNNNINKIVEEINKYKDNLNKEVDDITRRVKNKIKPQFTKQAKEWNEKIKNSNPTETTSENLNFKEKVNSYINSILEKSLNEEINKTISEIIDNFKNQSITISQKNLDVEVLHNKTQKVTINYTDYVTVTSNSKKNWFSEAIDWTVKTVSKVVDNIFNTNISDIMSDKRVSQRERTETKTVNVGTNFEEFFEDTLPKIEKYVKDETEKKLNIIRDTYFAKNEQFANNIQKEIKILNYKLNSLKYADNN